MIAASASASASVHDTQCSHQRHDTHTYTSVMNSLRCDKAKTHPTILTCRCMMCAVPALNVLEPRIGPYKVVLLYQLTYALHYIITLISIRSPGDVSRRARTPSRSCRCGGRRTTDCGLLEAEACKVIHMYKYMYVYIYIYICIFIERER